LVIDQPQMLVMTKISYIRDKRSPEPSSANVSKLMSKIRAKNTSPELTVRKILCENGFKGYRLHWKKVAGRPDIAWPGRKIAIFIHGCYWHRCPKCNLPLPKSNTEFWKNKFEANIHRDKKKVEYLQDNGWKVIVLWECEIKTDTAQIIEKVSKLMLYC